MRTTQVRRSTRGGWDLQEQVKSSAHVGETLGTLLFVTQDKTLAVLRETLLSRQDRVMPNILPSSPQGLHIGLWASSTQVTNPGTIRFPSSYPQHRKLLHTTFGPNSSGGEKCWKHEQGKDPGKQVHLPSVLQPSYHTPEHSCTLPQEGIKSAQAVLIERALTGGRHLFCCVSFSGAVQYH